MDVSYYDFGVDLLTSYDLDPIYPMVAIANISEKIMKRWLLAYWCYYHAGVSSRIAESNDFYEAMWQGVYQKWPRGMERRYFYGDTAKNALYGLKAYGTPEQVVDRMTQHRTFQDVNKAVQEFSGFGPWIAWKIADMAERVLQIDIDFSNSELGIYKDPVKGAAFIEFGDKNYPITTDELNCVVSRLESEFSVYKAPPYQDRPVNIQEVETILCKYKAHCYGFYPFGNDTFHIAKGLKGWGDLATQMYDNLWVCSSYMHDTYYE
jgi:hypothetical protein